MFLFAVGCIQLYLKTEIELEGCVRKGIWTNNDAKSIMWITKVTLWHS